MAEATPVSRFVVTELEGFAINAKGNRSTNNRGLSCMVVDTAYCHRVVATYRSEHQPGPQFRPGRNPRYPGRPPSIGYAGARQRASDHAARLNA